MWTKKFWKSATERSIKTLAQSLIALLTAGSANLLEVDWAAALGVSLGAALLSLLTSLGSAGVTKTDSPSLVDDAKD
jgi:hypothetical protein